MRGLLQPAWTEFKINLRDPMGVFWSLAFPALWFVFNAVVFTEPIPGSGYEGLNYASFLLPGSTGLVVLSASFIGVPMIMTTYRETGVLKRLRVTPVKTSTLALSFSISNMVSVAAGISILFVVGKFLLRIQVLGSWWP